MSNSNQKLLMAVLGGVAAGAAIGLLFAPEPGPETRRKIAQPVKDAASRAGDYVDNLVSEAKNSWFKAKGAATENAGVAAEEMDDFIRHIAQKGEKMWDKGKKKAKRAANDVEEGLDNARQEGEDFADDVRRETRKTGQAAQQEMREAGDNLSASKG